MVLLAMRFQGNPPHTLIRTYEALFIYPPHPPLPPPHIRLRQRLARWGRRQLQQVVWVHQQPLLLLLHHLRLQSPVCYVSCLSVYIGAMASMRRLWACT